MDTKEKQRRTPGRTVRRKNGGTNQAARRRAAEESARRQQAAARNGRPRRTVRQPREDLPPVTYTMPKPFSRGGFLLKLASMAAAVAAVLMCLSVFFRVEQVVVSGAEKYSAYSVMEASGVEIGDSLLTIRDASISGRVIAALPYVKEVRVGIKLPGTVNIQIEELDMTYAIQANDSSWWLIAADGRVIEQIESSAASGYTRILGLQVDGPRADQKVQAAEDREEAPDETESTGADQSGMTLPTTVQITGSQKLEVVLTVLENLEANGVIGQIVYLDVSNLNNITMEYGQRFDIVLGTSENLDYKIAYMAQAITQLPEYETGELDVSFKYSEKALLNPRA